MWQILTAEFRYTRDALIFGYTIAVAFMIAAIVIDSWGFFNFMWNTTITYFILMGILGAGSISEKRYRLHTMLPVKPHDLAVADALYVLLVQLGMSFLWVLFLLFRPEEIRPETPWVIVANTAAVLAVITLIGIHIHAGFFETKKYQRINWLVVLTFVLAVVALSYIGEMKPIVRFVWRNYDSPPGAFAVVLLWVGLSALSSAVFVRRKSYLA